MGKKKVEYEQAVMTEFPQVKRAGGFRIRGWFTFPETEAMRAKVKPSKLRRMVEEGRRALEGKPPKYEQDELPGF